MPYIALVAGIAFAVLAVVQGSWLLALPAAALLLIGAPGVVGRPSTPGRTDHTAPPGTSEPSPGNVFARLDRSIEPYKNLLTILGILVGLAVAIWL